MLKQVLSLSNICIISIYQSSLNVPPRTLHIRHQNCGLWSGESVTPADVASRLVHLH